MLRVDIGCGDTKPEGFIGVDICPGPGVDIVADISKTLPFEENSVDELRAYDVIEHLPDRINTMNEIWRVCKPGARVDILVPSSDGRGAFQDPTHISFWNINSFYYYCVDSPYYQLCRKYGFKGGYKLLHLEQIESPGQIVHVKAELEVVKALPAAVPNRSIPAAQSVSQNVAQNIPYSITPGNPTFIPATIAAIPAIIDSADHPFWSVMIPVFNPQYDYLRQTLESVLAQAPAESEMQIEVVDDCSTEGDIEAWVKTIGQGRIIYTRQPQNLGLLPNWDDCIRRAKGQWVHLLHQDDIVLLGFYDRLQAGIQNREEIGAAFCRHFHIDCNGDAQYLSELEQETPGILDDFLDRIAVRQCIQFASIVVQRSTFEALGGFCTEAGSAADWELWLRIAHRYPIWFEPAALASYRLHNASESSRLIETGQNLIDMRRAIDIVARYLPQDKIPLLDLAREYYARYGLHTAAQMLQRHKSDAVLAQLREGLKLSQSPMIQEQVMSLLMQSPVLYAGQSAKSGSDSRLETPVCLLIFKRPDTTERVFEAIRQAKPRQLFVVADGPRPDRPGEAAQCRAARAIIDRVDWDCEVIMNYSDVNLGSKQRVATGISWLFKQVEEAIILEDDCLPTPSFFEFCSELLQKYRHESQVMSISGNNFQFGCNEIRDSYYFSVHSSIWGWATWRRAWEKYDIQMRQWSELREQSWLESVLNDCQAAECWTKIFDAAAQGYTSWDYPWTYSCWLHKGLTIVPRTNLVTNIGFTRDATGNIDRIPPVFVNLFSEMPAADIALPLSHPMAIVPHQEADQFTQELLHNLYWQRNNWERIQETVLKTWKSLASEQLQQPYTTGNVVRLLKSSLMMQPAKTTGAKLAQVLNSQISGGIDRPEFLKALLIAMLACYPHQIDLPLEFDRIPDWLLDLYIEFLLKTPPIFNQRNEASQYYAYLSRLMDVLHRGILDNPDAEFWQNVAFRFTHTANLIPLYFTDTNLKEIYVKRAEILECYLEAQGHELDYEFPVRSSDRQKIRLGILSAHFSPQSETFASLPAYKHLNRDEYEIILFSIAHTEHRLEKYCAGHADAFVPLPSNLAEQVQLIRQADLDAIVITTNVTAVTNHIALLSTHRLARVQIANVCSCVSTGMRNMDYYLSGTLTDAEAAEEQYSETLLSIEGPSHCYDYGTEENVPPTEFLSRAALGIAEDEIVYISGSNFFKITPEVEQVWVEILRRVPHSRLILYPFNPNWSNAYPREAFLNRIYASLQQVGVHESRLILLEPAPSYGDVKQRLKLGNIYLDSFPFSGVTSLLDPLQVGLPTIVMDGNTFRSRMGPAFLRDLAMPELIASNDQEYVELAVQLGTNAQLWQQKQQAIEQAMQRSPRFTDSRYHSAQIGGMLQSLVEQHQIQSLQQAFNLRQTNLIAFPNWNQPEEDLFATLVDLLRFALTHRDRQDLTLLISTENWNSEDLNDAISSVLLYLMSEEGIEAEAGSEIVLIEPSNITPLLLTQLSGRIELDGEDQAMIQTRGVANLSTRSIQAVAV